MLICKAEPDWCINSVGLAFCSIAFVVDFFFFVILVFKWAALVLN